MEESHQYELDFRNTDWDDTEIIAAYDKSVKDRERAEKEKKEKKKQEKNPSVRAKHIDDKLHVGMHCKAIYSVDGCCYEAKVRKVGKDFCTVEFLGYGNLEQVDPMTLQESAGKKARKNQIKRANDENSFLSYTGESSDATSVSHVSGMNKKKLQESQVVNQMPSFDYSAAENSNAYQVPPQAAPYFAPPQVPQSMPFMPPVPPVPQCSSIVNNPLMSNLLISWYMAGYYTGLQQAQKGNSCSQRCCGRSNQCCHH